MMVPEEDELKKTAQKVLSNNDEVRKINDMIYIEIVGGGLAFGTLFCVYKLYKIYTKPKSAW